MKSDKKEIETINKEKRKKWEPNKNYKQKTKVGVDRARSKKWKLNKNHKWEVRNISEKWELGKSHKGESTLDNPFFGVISQFSQGGVVKL